MKVLVTGALGYLGSVMLNKLIAKGFEVRVLDAVVYGNFLSSNANLELIKGDIRDQETIVEATKNVDAVIHLAGIIGDAAVKLDTELTVDVNYQATRKLAELCSKKDIRLVFSSTCSVYGARPNEMISEKSPIAPLSLYAMSKWLSEESIQRRCRNFVIFRLGTLFGLSPRMRFDLVINRFIAQAIQEGKITVYGGKQRRPFVHVQDISDIFIKSLTSDTNGIFNIGGRNYRILDAAEILRSKIGCEVTILDQVDPRNYAVESTLSEETFGFRNPKGIEFAVDEIQNAYSKKVIKDYRQPIFNNEEWLRNLWQGSSSQAQQENSGANFASSFQIPSVPQAKNLI